MLEGHWELFVLYSTIAMICLVSATFLCMCGCKANERKDELVGIEGHVKMTNPEVLDTCELNGHVVTGVDVDRGTTTAKRSLPDLPPAAEGAATDVSWEPGGDTTSELYATVGVQKCANLEVATPLTPSDHPYDRLKSVEHPYAQVNKAEASTSHEEPGPPPPRLDIAAATAIAGHVQASDDLPYMTPPTHFSGDSQDSTKGYTSISVREPLAAIRAETAETRGTIEKTRGHYATVSDDSDDMYAAIEEPTSGSETYAQIGPPPPPPAQEPPTHSRQESCSSAASSSAVASPKPEKRQANSPLPAPPPEDRNLDDMYAKVNKIRRRDIHEDVLERGASTESAMTGSSESVSYKLQSNHTSTTDSSQSHSCHGQSTTTSTSTDSSAPNSRELQLAANAISHSSHSCTSHSTTGDDSLSSDPGHDNDNPRYETLGRKDPGYESLEKKDPGYETLNKKNPGYETLNKKNPGYEKLDNRNPGYASLRRTSDPGYETLNNGDDFISEPNYATLGKGPPSDSDPNYATLGKGLTSDSDPNYATLGKGPPSDSDPNYERIDPLGHDYASLPHRRIDESDGLQSHLYATVVKHKARHEEPPYASLAGAGENYSSEPDYESVQYSSGRAEPPYQLLADFESGTAQNNG